MSDNETEKVSRVESDVPSSDNESVSSSSSPALPDTPPPSRSGSDASPVASLSASVSTINTSSTEYNVTSGNGCPLSDSDLSDPDESTDYEKILNWSHLDQVPQETSQDNLSESSGPSGSSQTDNPSGFSGPSGPSGPSGSNGSMDLSKLSDDDLPPLVDEDDDDDDDDDDEEEDNDVEEEDENDCDADDEECESDSESEATYYIQVVPQQSQNEYPPLLTFLFFLFLFLHLVHYVLLLRDSRNSPCYSFRH